MLLPSLTLTCTPPSVVGSGSVVATSVPPARPVPKRASIASLAAPAWKLAAETVRQLV
jgi:hypothetical protein